MYFYPEELDEISELIRGMDIFVNSLINLKHLEIDWESNAEFAIPVLNKGGKSIGHLGYTDDGEIGFIVKVNE